MIKPSCLFLLAISLCLPSVADSQTTQKVVLTYSSRSIASIDLFIAQDRGFFREEGLDPQLVQVRATTAIAAIVSGEVHALGSIGSAIRAIPRGAPIKVGILSPPTVIVARDKYRMNILAGAMDEFTSLQNGLGVLEKNAKDPLVKRILRARAKGNRYFHQNEKGTAEVLAKYLAVDLNTAAETYRISRAAFTTDGIPTDNELTEYLKEDTQILGLPAPVPAAKVFDFTLQREVNRELGAK
jgi:ABC-type nitrate/sulfonate/bicarbonate transport system substrate-binding protein